MARTVKARTLISVAGVMTLTCLAVAGPVIASASSPPRHGVHTTNRTIKASEYGSGRSGSIIIVDPYAAGSKLTKIEYHMHDGYSKQVTIPGGAFVAAEDIAICGTKGQRYANNGYVGTGLPCRPYLHRTEVFYHQDTGDLAGRFRPHKVVEVPEICHGTGRFLTVGHIDHGTMMSVEYYWANGEHLTVNLRGDVLIDHVQLLTAPGGLLSAVVVRHP